MTSKQAEIGQVPSEWEISELVTYLDRITYGFTNPMPDTDKGPWKVTAKDIVNGYINYHSARHTTEEAFENKLTDKSKPRIGDVLLTKDGSIGRVAVVDRDGICINQSVALLRPNDKILPFFLKYLLITPHYQRVMERDSDGSTIKHIYITRVDKMQVAVPPIDEQKGILSVVKALDDKIELNRRTNETLEAIARAIFKSWFVDFDPVRAKASDEPHESICRRFGLTSELLTLFPDRLQDSELGDIPDGWSTESVYDLATYINGAAYRAFEPNEERRGLPIIKIAELKAGVTAQTRYSDLEMPEKYKIDRGDLLFSWSGNPDTSIDTFVWTNGPAWLNQHIFRVVPHNIVERPFVYLLLKHLRSAFAEIARNKQTTGLGHVTVEDLKRLKVAQSPKAVLMGWNEIVTPLLDQMFILNIENQSLAGLRDTLLPKLLSGELRVPLTGMA